MSLLRYPGGKSKLKSKIMPFFEKLANFDDFDNYHYTEPFVGGGSFLLYILEKYGKKIKSISINDKDLALSALWTSVLNNPDELIKLIHEFTPTVDYFFETKEELLDLTLTSERDCLDIGFKQLALHQISYSGLGSKAGGPIGGKTQGSKYDVGCRWNPTTIEKKIRKINNLLSSVEVTENRCTSYDFQDVILASPIGSLIYLDPPYYQMGNDLYQEGFTLEDHERLSRLLYKVPMSWALSYDDCPETNELYHWANIVPLETKYTINNVEKIQVELLILNDKYKPQIDTSETVIVRPHEYFLCHRTSLNYATRHKIKNHYNNGVINTVDDPRRTERIGLLGEAAFAKWINRGLHINFEYTRKGVPEDFTLNTYTIDVKSSSRNPRVWYIKVFDNDNDKEKNYRHHPKCDIYVFTSVDESTNTHTAKVKICGWVVKKTILKLPPKKAPGDGEHWNYEVTLDMLNPMEDLEQHCGDH